jgi:glycine/D-amino acid oxidase-like deaminating enzyme
LCESLSCHPGIERGTVEGLRGESRAKVWCLGPAAREAPDAAWLELVPIAGQIDVLELGTKPRLPLIGDGFVAPIGAGRHAVGATYEHRPWEVERASAFNTQRLARFFTHIGLAPRIVRRHPPLRGVRAVTSDRTPIISALPRSDGANDWMNAGHGSSGTITAPLGAACIAAMLAGDFAPLTTEELAQFGAERFAVRQRRRGLRHGASAVNQRPGH